MPLPPDQEEKVNQLREKIIGLGESSIRKSYYSELQHRLAELERFRALLDQSTNQFFLLKTPDGTIEDTTRPVAERLGFPAEHLLGKCFLDFFRSDAIDEVRQYLSSAHGARPEEIRFVAWLRSIAGVEIPMEFLLSRVEFDGVGYVIAVGQEISERILAEQQIQAQLSHLSALHEIDLAITSNQNMPDTLDSVLGQIVSALQVDAAAIITIQPDGLMRYGAWRGFHKQTLAGLPVNHLNTDSSNSLAMNDLVYIPNLTDRSELVCGSPVFGGENFRGYASYPLQAQGELKGVLEVFHRSSMRVSESWINYLKSYAAQAAIAVSNSQLLLDLHQAYSDLQNTYDDTLAGWALALELREHETGQHTRRVQELTGRLAAEIGFTGNDLVQIRRGAMLHDIGKMAIPDKILLKPGPLDDEEWKVMRMHPEYAYEMLSHIAFLKPCLDIPYCHHEKWNGAGYPRGLRGEQIPLGARIFSVIDVWDALLSDRPYRKAWSQPDVVHYLEGEAGTHFDPAILQLFIKLVVK